MPTKTPKKIMYNNKIFTDGDFVYVECPNYTPTLFCVCTLIDCDGNSVPFRVNQPWIVFCKTMDGSTFMVDISQVFTI